MLTAAGVLTVALAMAAPATGPHLTVDAAAGHHRISPGIYGVNFADEGLAKAVGLPVDRWGGDSTETYSWKIRGTNEGWNWYFENFPDCWTQELDWCADGTHDYSAVDELIEKDARVGATTLLTLPAAGWVAKAVSYTGDQLCSYPSATFDPQDDHDPYNPACGNGQRAGAWVQPGADPAHAGTAAGAAWDQDWVEHLVSTYGSAADGGVGIYAIGNEPGLWSVSHHDFHPDPLSYDELWSTSRAIATAVKTADPTAKVLGPAEWGWPNYFCSTADVPDNGCSPQSPDRAAHGGTDLSSWYLRRFAALQRQTGVRALDYFDLHYYPQGTYGPATSVTRSLWDPAFRDPSWIDATIRLLPRMRAWVRDNYPGTRTSVSEYNMGLDVTGDPRLQNVIEADTLGIFGREGLDLATFWPEDSSPVPAAALRIFRSYDGHHHGFGDRGVRAVSSAEGRMSVFAARRGATGPLTVVVVNKSGAALRSRLDLRHFPHAASARAFRYAGAGIASLGRVRLGASGVTSTYPGRSVTLLEIAAAGGHRRQE